MAAILLTALLPALASAALASPTHASPGVASTCRGVGRTPPPGIGGVARARPSTATCRSFASTSPADLYNGGTPPLTYHGGSVMGTPSVLVTPVFWGPPGAFTANYVRTITQYIRDVAHDSGARTNVFSTVREYGVAYSLAAGAPIMDANPFPASGCTVDTGPVYADASGYSTCLDDGQLQTEVGAVSGGRGGLGQMYVLLLPKGVESCFLSAADPVADQQCTINPSPTSTYCGYHGALDTPDVVYAALPFPIYSSATNSSCTDETLGGGVQAPNGDRDADVLISTLSHEMAEALTDPNLDAWFDDGNGNENGDECAYDYGGYSGSAGSFWNQTINGHHYLTQTEFSNAAYRAGRYGCIQTTTGPAVTSVSVRSGPTGGGRSVTITGTAFTGASRVLFGGVDAAFTVRSDTSITAVAPRHGAATVDVRVVAPGGASAARSSDRYRYGAPVVTALSPAAGPTSAGHVVTISGAGFTGARQVRFGTAAARFSIDSDSRITAITPAHAQSAVTVSVVNGAGTNAATTATRYTFLDRPRLTHLSPAAGSHLGGTTVIVTGANFFRVTAVRFGYTAAAFTVDSSTRITVRTPAQGAGSLNVLVSTPGGTSAVTSADRYRVT